VVVVVIMGAAVVAGRVMGAAVVAGSVVTVAGRVVVFKMPAGAAKVAKSVAAKSP
jgi:hypothetical protein